MLPIAAGDAVGAWGCPTRSLRTYPVCPLALTFTQERPLSAPGTFASSTAISASVSTTVTTAVSTAGPLRTFAPPSAVTVTTCVAPVDGCICIAVSVADDAGGGMGGGGGGGTAVGGRGVALGGGGGGGGWLIGEGCTIGGAVADATDGGFAVVELTGIAVGAAPPPKGLLTPPHPPNTPAITASSTPRMMYRRIVWPCPLMNRADYCPRCGSYDYAVPFPHRSGNRVRRCPAR